MTSKIRKRMTVLFVLALAGFLSWHGFAFELGQEGQKVHFKFHVKPLSRFFI